jgi:transcriptional regulator with XRE-family HTH domain
MKDRLKQLRSELKLTQQEFADKLGIKRATIGNYEVGRNEPIDAVIKLICDTFRVNESWLRNGTGEMFVSTSEYDDLKKMVDAMLADDSADLKRRLVAAILRLSPDQIARGVDWLKSTFGLVEAGMTPQEIARAHGERVGKAAEEQKLAELLDGRKDMDA